MMLLFTCFARVSTAKSLCRWAVDWCNDKVRAVNLLIANHCFELNVQEDKFQRSELHFAYQFANLQNIDLLLAAGARADATDAMAHRRGTTLCGIATNLL
jgi:hypothetical protein